MEINSELHYADISKVSQEVLCIREAKATCCGMAFWLQPASSRDLFDMYLTRWAAVFLLQAVGKKASTDLPGGNRSRHSVGSAGVWVSVRRH